MNFDRVQKIAAAILYEGYILYPYRPTAIKNRQRWNFGTLYPRSYAEAQRPPESSRLIAECLLESDPDARLDVKINFLQLAQRENSPVSDGLHKPSDPSIEWQEAVERTSEHPDLRLSDLIASPLVLTLRMDTVPLSNNAGGPLIPALQAVLTVGAVVLQNGAFKLHLQLQNTSPVLTAATANRDEALPRSFVSAHILLGLTKGEFVSLLDPGPMHSEAAKTCSNVGVFPVLAGEEPDRTTMFCSPIILYDYPKIAPESEGDFFDCTEMDEMLTLRVLTLTDAEKQAIRDGDPTARRILERTEALTPESLLKAHGVIRSMREIRGDAQ